MRARINVLCEMPDEWAARVGRAGRGLNARAQDRRRRTAAAPSTRTTSTCSTRRWSASGRSRGSTAGTRADFVRPHQAYMVKAMQGGEGAHELDQPGRGVRRGAARVRARVSSTRTERPVPRRLRAVRSGRSRHFGLFNSLAQTLFKLTAPGVPDIYQGNGAVGLQPRGPGQPPAGRLRQAGPAAGGVAQPGARPRRAGPRAGRGPGGRADQAVRVGAGPAVPAGAAGAVRGPVLADRRGRPAGRARLLLRPTGRGFVWRWCWCRGWWPR